MKNAEYIPESESSRIKEVPETEKERIGALFAEAQRLKQKAEDLLRAANLEVGWAEGTFNDTLTAKVLADLPADVAEHFRKANTYSGPDEDGGFEAEGDINLRDLTVMAETIARNTGHVIVEVTNAGGTPYVSVFVARPGANSEPLEIGSAMGDGDFERTPKVDAVIQTLSKKLSLLNFQPHGHGEASSRDTYEKFYRHSGTTRLMGRYYFDAKEVK